MRENGHEQGIVGPWPCLHMKAEIASMYAFQLLPPWGCQCEHKMHLQFPDLRNISQL